MKSQDTPRANAVPGPPRDRFPHKDGSLQDASSSTAARKPTSQDQETAPSPSVDGPWSIGEQSDGTAQKTGQDNINQVVSDQDWIRSHTSRLLGLVDDDNQSDERGGGSAATRVDAEDAPGPEGRDETHQQPTPPPEEKAHKSPAKGTEAQSDDQSAGASELEYGDNSAALDQLRQSGRIFVRNLPYTAGEDELASAFEPFGTLQEVSANALRAIPFARTCMMIPDRDS